MDDSENGKDNETKDISLEYLERNSSNNSTINNIKNENNKALSIYENKNELHKEIDNLKTVKIDSSNSNNKFIIPQELKKTYMITIILTITGIALTICGIIKALIIKKIGRGLMFWILAILVLIPGGFYSIQFYRARHCEREYERQEILDSIPKLQ